MPYRYCPFIAILILSLFSPSVYSEDDYARGKIAVEFKSKVAEKEAVEFISQFDLEIIKKVNFGIRHLSFNIEKNIDNFIRAVQRERIVASVTEGEGLTIDGREGTVVRIKFKRGTSRKKMDELKLKYSGREEIIAWRYEKKGTPYIILKVPVGKEQSWAETVRSAEDGDTVESVNLITFDIPY